VIVGVIRGKSLDSDGCEQVAICRNGRAFAQYRTHRKLIANALRAAFRGQSLLQPGECGFFEINSLLNDASEPFLNASHLM